MIDELLKSPAGLGLQWSLLLILVYLAMTRLLPWIAERRSSELAAVMTEIWRAPVMLVLGVTAVRELALASGLPEPWANVIEKLYSFALYMLVAWLIWVTVRTVLGQYAQQFAAESESKIDDVLVPLLTSLTPLVTVVALLIAFAGLAGVEFSAIITVFGAFAFLLAFVLQEPLSNLFSGVYLLLDQPFQIGDFVQIGEGTYIVRRIGTRVTELYDVDKHTTVYVPNNKLASETIVNVTKPTVELRVKLTVGVAYESVADDVARLLTKICDAHEHVLGDATTKIALLKARIDSLTGPERVIRSLALERVELEYRMRQQWGRFVTQLDLLARYAHTLESSGMSKAEFATLAQLADHLLASFRDQCQDLTIWLTVRAHEFALYKIEDTDVAARLLQTSLRDAMSVSAVKDRFERGLLRRIGEDESGSWLDDFDSSGVVYALTEFRSKASKRAITPTDVSETTDEILAELPEVFMLDDFRVAYGRWFRLVRRVARDLTRLAAMRDRRTIGGFQVDALVADLRELVRGNFPLPPERWQWPDAKVVGFGASTLDFEVEFFVDDLVTHHYEALDDVFSDLRAEIVRRFDEAEIEIPFPQADIRFRTPLTTTGAKQ